MQREYTYSHRLMGSDLEISLIATDEAVALREHDTALALGMALEKRFSRFLADSELTELNTKKSMVVSPEFLEVFLIGRTLYRETHGIFNPLVQIERFGYTKTFQSIEGIAPLEEETPYDTDMESIIVDETTRHITLKEGQRLDFGGFLKGYAAEAMARGMRDVTGAIVNLGGDIFTIGTDAEGAPFMFTVFNPVTGEQNVSIPVQDAGLATSGTYRRHWKTIQGRKHHILRGDGHANPDTDVVSATIVARDGFRSDAYATTAIVLGSIDAPLFLNVRDTKYILITTSGSLISNIS